MPRESTRIGAYVHAVRRLDTVELAALLQQLPGLVAGLPRKPASGASHTSLAHLGGNGRGNGQGAPRDADGARPLADLPGLVGLLASRAEIIDRLQRLDHTAFQLVTLACWHHGTLTREQVLEEAGPDAETRLEAAAEELRRLVLADRDETWLRLLPDVIDIVGPPGLRARDMLERAGSQMLDTTLRHLGVRPIPASKAARVELIERCLRDRTHVQALLEGLSAEQASVFRLIVDHGGSLDLDLIGQSLNLDLGLVYLLGSDPYAVVPRRLPPADPLFGLSERGLLWINLDRFEGVVPLDVIAALTGRVFASWPTPPEVDHQPLQDVSPALPGIVTVVDAVLQRLDAHPAAALKAGGLGVRELRAIAKALGVEVGRVALATTLAIELDLLGTVVTGFAGRRGQPDEAWTVTVHAESFRAEPPLRRWAPLMLAWQHGQLLDEVEGLPERVEVRPELWTQLPELRAALLDTLASLPPGVGVGLDDLARLVAFRHPTRPKLSQYEGMIAALRELGMVPPAGPIGLSALGRALVADGVAAAERLLPASVETFVVQPDLSVVAPPDLDAEVVVRLSRYAVLESEAGARLLRLDEVRIAQAFDDGDDAEEVLAFLTAHSRAALPQNVEHLVRDVARRHGQLRVGAASSYLVCDDPVLLTDALRVRTAKLRQVAPTVAVSSLSRTKLLAALAGKGLMPVAEDAAGATLTTRRELGTPLDHSIGPMGAPEYGLLRANLRDQDLLDLAQELLTAPDPGPVGTSTRATRHFGGR